MAPFAVLLLISLGQARPVSKPDFEALSAAAENAKAAERLDDAAALYRKALSLRPDWAAGWWSLGTIAYDRNEYEQAAQYFERAAACAPKDGTARVMLGLCEFELGREDRALQHIEEGRNLGVAKSPQLRDVMFFHEGVLLQRKGRFESAREVLASLCLGGAESTELTRTLGMVALRLRDRNPPAQGTPAADVVARIGRAECLAGRKKIEDARAAYEAAVAASPGFPNIHYAYGKFLLDSQDIKAGVAQMEQEIARNPGNVIARLQIAAAWYKVDSAKGLAYAREGVKLDPEYPFGHYLLGLLLLDTDDFKEAIPQLEIAARVFTREPGVFSALGAAYARAGRNEDAARARARFLRLKQEQEKTAEAPGETLDSSREELMIRPPR